MSLELVRCPDCGGVVPADNIHCPRCGGSFQSRRQKIMRWAFVAAAVLVIAAMLLSYVGWH